MVTPKDLRELYYICNGKLTNRIAGKAHAAGGQATLKEKYAPDSSKERRKSCIIKPHSPKENKP